MHATKLHIDVGNTFAYLDLHLNDLLVYSIHGKISTFTCRYEWYVFLNVFPQQVKFLAKIFYDISFDQHFQIITLFMFILHMKFLHHTRCISFHTRWNVWYIQLLFELTSLQHLLLNILLGSLQRYICSLLFITNPICFNFLPFKCMMVYFG